MKYAIISYESKKLRLDGTDRINIGNLIQTIAVENLLKGFGVTDYVKLSINDVNSWPCDEELVLLVYGWNSFSDLTQFERLKIPFGSNVYPIFCGFNLETPYIPEDAKEYFDKYGPIGCRDEGTFNRLCQKGIDAYISGCFTALLPQREKNVIEQTKIYFVDAPKELYEFVPKEIMCKAEFETNMYHITRTCGSERITEEEMEICYQYANERLCDMAKYACLVVTSRLHIASPCVAMGIPVILAKKNIDKRFAWLDKYIPLYSFSEWHKINWNPEMINYEKEKERMKQELKKLLFENDFEEAKKNIHNYYFDRNKGIYNEVIRKGFSEFDKYLKKYEKISICGVVTDTIWIISCLKEEYPNLIVESVYDEYLSNTSFFEGIKVEKISNMNYMEDVIYVITSRNASNQLSNLMKNNKFKYIVTDIEQLEWKSNLDE